MRNRHRHPGGVARLEHTGNCFSRKLGEPFTGSGNKHEAEEEVAVSAAVRIVSVALDAVV